MLNSTSCLEAIRIGFCVAFGAGLALWAAKALISFLGWALRRAKRAGSQP